MPAVPFPQRLQKSRIEEQFARFLKTFQKFEISMPFTEVVTQMPLYAKFLKEILSKKRRIAEEGVVNLTTTYSAVIKKTLPEKMKDPENLFDVVGRWIVLLLFALIVRRITVGFSSGMKMLTYHNLS